MATDITTLLIQMIQAGSTQADGLAVNGTVLESAADVLSLAANWVQVLGTLEGPLAQASVAGTLGQIADQQAKGQLQSGAAPEGSALASDALTAGQAAEAGALVTGAAGGFFAILVEIVSVLLAGLMASSGQSSNQALFQALTDAIDSLADDQLATYWLDKMSGSLSVLWSPVGIDLDNLASEGTGGINVTTDASHFHDDGLAFVNHLVKDIGWDQYWQVPAQPAGDVPQSGPSPQWWTDGSAYWTFESWYGQFPMRLTLADSPSGNVSDPRTMAPVLALGIQSYLTLESLLNFIDSTQPTLKQFAKTFSGDLQEYTTFLYGMYTQAVNGIVKTDLPSEDEMLGTFWFMTQRAFVFAHPSTNPTQDTSQSWGAPWPFPGDQPVVAYSGNGWAWNFIYGASETYPQYGFYGNAQIDQLKRNVYTPAYIFSAPDTTNAVSEWQQALILFNAEGQTYASIDYLQSWTIPWLNNRLILGRMARWKAIYLLNAFDGVWSVLQALQRLTASNPPIVPKTMILQQDGTIADGNWSTRELCEVVQVNAGLLTGNAYVDEYDQEFVITWTPSLPTGGPLPLVAGHSVGGLVQFLYNVANGSWAGPPQVVQSDNSPPRPLSFRGLLAGAAA